MRAWLHTAPQGGANRSEQVLSNHFSREMAQFKFPKILEKLVHDKVMHGSLIPQMLPPPSLPDAPLLLYFVYFSP